MSYVTSAWLEHRLRPDRQRLVCPDAAADEATARAAAEQEAVERELLELRWVVKSLRTDLALARLRQKYSPDQPRAPAGSPRGGRWIGAFSLPDQRPAQNEMRPRPTVLAQAGFGRLVAEIRVPGGRRCVYNFGPISIVAPGPTNLNCSSRMHWSGLTHGQLLNDN